MANTIDFMNAVHDEVARVLGDADGGFMQLAWPGMPLNPADFRRADAPHGAVDPDIAMESLAALANIVPTFNKIRFQNSGFDVDDLYEILLTSAIPTGATADTVADDPRHRRFCAAQRALMQARRGRHADPGATYYPCTASPTAWYDEAATAGWTTIQLGHADIKPASASNMSCSSFARSGGLELARTGAWRLRAAVLDNAAIRNKLRAAALARPGPGKRPLDAPASAARSTELFAPAAAPTHAIGRGGLDIDSVDLLRRDLGVIDLARRLAVKNLFDRQTPALPPSPTTDGFNCSFRACRVDIARPWLDLDLLGAGDWWMCATPAGAYSTGDADVNAGMFPLLTTSFVAIRDLKLAANWAQDDRKHLGNAASFGCFDLRNGIVANNTIEVKGLQIIAWMSRVMPRLPPESAP